MHEHLPDLAGRGEILALAQTVSLIIAGLSGNRLLANLHDLIGFARGILL
jgi:hypothetical protein